MVIKLDGSTALDALEGFRRAFSPLPPQVCHTLTYDQGK
jgi:IS30 family transposase